MPPSRSFLFWTYNDYFFLPLKTRNNNPKTQIPIIPIPSTRRLPCRMEISGKRGCRVGVGVIVGARVWVGGAGVLVGFGVRVGGLAVWVVVGEIVGVDASRIVSFWLAKMVSLAIPFKAFISSIFMLYEVAIPHRV